MNYVKPRFLLVALGCMLCLISCARSDTVIGPGYSTLPDDYSGKTVINLTAVSIDYRVLQYAEAFNAQSEKYAVNVSYYVNPGTQATELISYDDELKRFNTDLMAGYVPDIVLCDERLPVSSYINKGVFADLYAYMDTDPDFDMDNYLINAFTASEYDGKLYDVFPAFYVQTMYAKVSDAGDMQDWTMDTFLNLITSRQDLEYIVGGYTRNDFIMEMLPRLFTELEANKISIDRTELLKLFEVAERLPSEYDQAQVVTMLGMRNGDPVINEGTLGSPRDIRTWEQIYAGEEIACIGFPRFDTTAMSSLSFGDSYFSPFFSLAVMEKAGEKDGAWAFIKFMLDYDIDNIRTGTIPVKLSRINNLIESAKGDYEGMEYAVWFSTEHAPSGRDEPVDITMDFEGNIIDSSNTTVKITVGNNTDEDNEKFMKLIQSVSSVRRYDAVITNIVSEEINAYLSGQHTVDQTADALENRINLYLSEIA